MVVVDYLCVYSCLKILVRYRDYREVYFIMQSRGWMDRFVIKILSQCGWRFVPLEYDLKPVNKNRPLFNIYKELDDFFERCITPKIQKSIYQNRYFSVYEKKRISTYLELMEKKKLYRSIEILYILGLYEGDIGRPKAVLLNSSLWRDELIALYKEKGYKVNFYTPLFLLTLEKRDKYIMDDYIAHNASFLFCMSYLISKIVKYVTNSMYFYIVRYLNSSLPSHIGKFDISAIIPAGPVRTEWFNDLFWKREFKMKGHPTLAILYGELDKKAYDAFRYLAECWISLNEFTHPPYIFSIYYWLWPKYPKILISNLTQMVRSFFESRTPFYYWFEIINLWIEVSKMEMLFRMTGTNIFWTSIEGQDRISVAGSLAINRLKGVSIGSTWSIFGIQDFKGHRNALDIWFIWGSKHAEIFRKEVCKTMVICGYPGDFYLREHLNKAKDLRKAWKEEYGAEIIACYYDNIISYDINHSFTSTIEYLEILLRWFQKQSKNILLVIKSKRKNIIDIYPPQINNLLGILEEQKRLIYKIDKADLSPGLASDLIIGVGVATLPCLLGAYGKEVVLLDPNEINEKDPLDLENIKFIKQGGDIVEILERWKVEKNKNIKNELTDIRYIPSRIDPFVDGCTSQRIAGYISKLFLELEKGLGSDIAIYNANRVYGECWGTDKVIEMDKFYDEKRF